MFTVVWDLIRGSERSCGWAASVPPRRRQRVRAEACDRRGLRRTCATALERRRGAPYDHIAAARGVAPDGSGEEGGAMDTVIRLLAEPSAWAALATLIAMEVVLGVDNLVFVAILANRVETGRRALARTAGLSLALVFRLVLLAFAAEIVHLTQ